jgi:hypothetical protein
MELVEAASPSITAGVDELALARIDVVVAAPIAVRVLPSLLLLLGVADSEFDAEAAPSSSDSVRNRGCGGPGEVGVIFSTAAGLSGGEGLGSAVFISPVQEEEKVDDDDDDDDNSDDNVDDGDNKEGAVAVPSSVEGGEALRLVPLVREYRVS